MLPQNLHLIDFVAETRDLLLLLFKLSITQNFLKSGKTTIFNNLENNLINEVLGISLYLPLNKVERLNLKLEYLTMERNYRLIEKFNRH